MFSNSPYHLSSTFSPNSSNFLRHYQAKMMHPFDLIDTSNHRARIKSISLWGKTHRSPPCNPQFVARYYPPYLRFANAFPAKENGPKVNLASAQLRPASRTNVRRRRLEQRRDVMYLGSRSAIKPPFNNIETRKICVRNSTKCGPEQSPKCCHHCPRLCSRDANERF